MGTYLFNLCKYIIAHNFNFVKCFMTFYKEKSGQINTQIFIKVKLLEVGSEFVKSNILEDREAKTNSTLCICGLLKIRNLADSI